MSAGDLRFYHSDGSPADAAIALTGPFVHVEIDLGDGTAIGELLTGLQHYALPSEPPGRVVAFPTSDHTGAAPLANALAWAQAEAAQHLGYGWADVADAALAFLDPGAPFVAQARAYDCSDFCTRFLLHAGVPLPAAIASEPHTVTPSALAAALGVK